MPTGPSARILRHPSLAFLVVAASLLLQASAPRVFAAGPARPWAEFVETDHPFFSSVLDARRLGDGWPINNLTPRGVILNLGHDCWACFDLDLLRVAAIWTGRGVTPVSMSQGSYQDSGAKAPPGQTVLPEIVGTPWLANGIHPGWQDGPAVALEDPRSPGPDPREVGRGPLPDRLGRFIALHPDSAGTILEYEVFGVSVLELLAARITNGHPVFQRTIRLSHVPRPLLLVLGTRPRSASPASAMAVSVDNQNAIEPVATDDGVHAVRVRPSATPVQFAITLALGDKAAPWNDLLSPWPSTRTPIEPARAAVPTTPLLPLAPRWPDVVTTRAILAPAAVAREEAFVIDTIGIPTANPWRRNVRLTDLAFDPSMVGRAAAVTYDGDVWRIDGLEGDLAEVRWKRVASGFHEPMGLAYRDGDLFICDRNGLWRLHDIDGDGKVDRHELFSNVYTQTAETREFATGFRVAPDGTFVVSKGGQQTASVGRDNGRVLRIARDGRSYTTLGWGLRQPFIGVHPRTGLVTASDQQGNYVPATPLHIVDGNRYFGFLSPLLPKERYPAPIADPATWIPHPVNASGASQVWLVGARMGPLSEAMIHLGYFRPELFIVRWNERTRPPEAAVVSLTRDLPFAPLNGAVNPADGQLYVIGMQIWGTIAREISGLARVRYTGAPSTVPRAIVPTEQGVLLRFDVPLDPAGATNLASYSAERWNYRRTAEYGSPHYRLDGSKGQETMFPSSASLSRDGRAVFIAFPGMVPVMQLRLGWTLQTRESRAFASSAYFTPRALTPFRAVDEGFGDIRIDLTTRPQPLPPPRAGPPTAAEGRRVAELMGCVACHSDDGSTIGKVGPTWKGLYLSPRELVGGARVIADETYLRESIQTPPAKVVKSFENGDIGMPSYEGVLTEAQIEALVLHLKSLR